MSDFVTDPEQVYHYYVNKQFHYDSNKQNGPKSSIHPQQFEKLKRQKRLTANKKLALRVLKRNLKFLEKIISDTKDANSEFLKSIPKNVSDMWKLNVNNNLVALETLLQELHLCENCGTVLGTTEIQASNNKCECLSPKVQKHVYDDLDYNKKVYRTGVNIKGAIPDAPFRYDNDPGRINPKRRKITVWDICDTSEPTFPPHEDLILLEKHFQGLLDQFSAVEIQPNKFQSVTAHRNPAICHMSHKNPKKPRPIGNPASAGNNDDAFANQRFELPTISAIAETFLFLMVVTPNDISYDDWCGLWQTAHKESDRYTNFIRAVKKAKDDNGVTHHETIIDAASMFIKNSNTFKLDPDTDYTILKSDQHAAYDSTPVEEFDDNLLRFYSTLLKRWRLIKLKSLQFGDRRSAYAYQRLLRAPIYLINMFGLCAPADYIDDTITYLKKLLAQTCADILRAIFQIFGIISEKKFELDNEVEVLGLVFSIKKGILTVTTPIPKIEKLQQRILLLLQQIKKEKIIGKPAVFCIDTNTLQQVLGLAEHVVVCSRLNTGKNLWMSMYKYLSHATDTIKLQHHDMDDLAKAAKNLYWWATNAAPLVLSPLPYVTEPIRIYFDASETHMGIVINFTDHQNTSKYVAISTKLPDELIKMATKEYINPIAIYELATFYLGIHYIINKLSVQYRRLHLYGDNRHANASFRKGFSKKGRLMCYYARIIHKLLAHNNCWFYCSYVNTKFNIADAFTRPEKLRVMEEKLGVKAITYNLPPINLLELNAIDPLGIAAKNNDCRKGRIPKRQTL